LSPQKVRRAISYGTKILASDNPFANAKFRTDGKTVILQVLEAEPEGRSAPRLALIGPPGRDTGFRGHSDGAQRVGARGKLIDLFKHGQYLMHKMGCCASVVGL
jgi:hypothetical protein